MHGFRSTRSVVPHGGRLLRLACLAGVVAAAGCAGGPPPAAVPGPNSGTTPEPASPAPDPASGPVGAFTGDQAARGRRVFSSMCAECHGASEFRGSDFLFRWRRRSAWDLYRDVSANMPEDAPGSLTDGEYADVIAWILEMNGHAAGDTELAATAAAMDSVPVDPGPPERSAASAGGADAAANGANEAGLREDSAKGDE